MEQFREIEGYDGKYLISNYGRVKSTFYYRGSDERILKQYVHKETGYAFVRLFVGKRGHGSKYKNHDVHRLVAKAFIQNPKELLYVNHKDENKTNNCADNLEWCTAKYNSNYGTAMDKVRKKVLQFDLEGNLLNEFNSITDAAIYCGHTAGNISSCCHGRLKQAYGYVWKFKGAW